MREAEDEESRARKVEEKVKKMEEQYSALVLTQIEKTGTPEVSILQTSHVIHILYNIRF